MDLRNRTDAIAVSGSQEALPREYAVDKFIDMVRKPGEFVFWIIEPDAGWIVMEYHDPWGTISIYLKPYARGQGAGAMAIKQMCKYAAGELGLEKIWANVREENISSSSVFTKCGFVLSSTNKSLWNFTWEPKE